MHPNAQCITTFYEAFSRLDAPTMAMCYHTEATFTDEAFINLNREQTVAMWTMLCSRAKNFSLTFSNIEANDTKGKAHWEPIYTFTGTGRLVHNIIDSEFEFKDGKIWRQRDTFDFYRWSRQAFGPIGIMLGWTGFLRKKVQTEAGKSLEKFMTKNS